MKRRVLNLLIALDQFVLSILTLGNSDPDWTISAYAWKWEQEKKWNWWLRPLIDWMFSPLESDHCYTSYLREVSRWPSSQ